MYNKLFAKILDSSIWLENDQTVRVWITFLAAMDEDGFAAFASIPNLAHRARVSLDATQAAVTCLESPDPHSSDPEHAGRRIERVPGGWVVLNARVYRDMASREQARRRTAERVRRFRAKGTESDSVETREHVTLNGHDVTVRNVSETPSEAYTETKNTRRPRRGARVLVDDPDFDRWWSIYPVKQSKIEAQTEWAKLRPSAALVETMVDAVRRQAAAGVWWHDGTRMRGRYGCRWIKQQRWTDPVDVPAVESAESAAAAERARTVEVLKARESLLDGARSGDR